MLIGVPKEIKTNENRIALVPAGAEALVAAGHQVFIEKGAGEGSGFDDSDYTGVGAQIAPDAATTAQSISAAAESGAGLIELVKEAKGAFGGRSKQSLLLRAAAEELDRYRRRAPPPRRGSRGASKSSRQRWTSRVQ